MKLDAVVPSWLVSACPQLRALTVDDCHYVDWVQERPNPMSAQLQVLDLGASVNSSYPKGQGRSWKVWLEQLDSLAALTSLTCPLHPYLLSGCPNLLAHLNQLSLLVVFVNDKDMEVLLSMPRLARVTCRRFRLAHSYS